MFSFITIIITIKKIKYDIIMLKVNILLIINTIVFFFLFFPDKSQLEQSFFCIKALLLKLNNEFSRQLSCMQAYT